MTSTSPNATIASLPRAGSGRGAFTLVEVLLVMLVLAVLAAIVGPRIAGTQGRRSVEDQARMVGTLCRQARSRAALEGRTYLVLIDATAGTAQLVRRRDPLAAPADGSSGMSASADPELEVPDAASWAKPVTFADGVKVTGATRLGVVALTSAPLSIAFRPDGDADATTIQFEGLRGDRYTLTVDGPMGLSHVELTAEASP